ncbi:hypothetical protein G5V57_11315 [Nordella sp. HKS 07]|uniref:hypothetical protein n=1 Tax=Nordella sp. HKS 07 TaxID=2712222 RepID=UPI0013E11929|nr:hypothetical protein [Nordella sp. HKS 07]QIG48263.1 hypothetical protein G5V57_11315 [Nordella sp. HKS 07]
MKIRITIMAFLFAGIAGSFVASPADAQRYVIVNGQFLNSAQIQRLEQLGCVSIPDGNYWLRSDGWWGYAGDPTPQGQLGDYCRKPSLSERGLLYRPGEILGE